MRILNNLDLAGNELQNARIQNLAVAPVNPVVGQIYFNTSDGYNTLYIWNGTKWVDALKQGTEMNVNDIISLLASVEVEGTGLNADLLDGKHANEFQAKLNVTGIVKGSAGNYIAAVAGIDYAPATSGAGILKANGAGGFADAVEGIDYVGVEHKHKISDITDVNYNGAYVENKVNLAILGSDGMIPSANLPSYVDDVIDIITVADTAPLTASVGDKYVNTSDNKIYTWLSSSTWDSGVALETGKIYISTDTAHQWRYSGSTLVDLSAGSATLHKFIGECIGDGVTKTFNINHGLNTKDVVINVYDKRNNDTILVDTVRTNDVNIAVNFAVAPQVGDEYRVVIIA